MKVRLANKNDKYDIFCWRNDEHTINMSFEMSKIDWQQHCIWFNRILDDENKMLLICEDEKRNPIGVVRFDIVKSQATVSINLNPIMRGRGLGQKALTSCISFFNDSHHEINILLAEIKTNNIASIKSFAGAGFVELDHLTDSKICRMKLEL